MPNVSCIRHSLKGHSDIFLTIPYTTNRLSIYDVARMHIEVKMCKQRASCEGERNAVRVKE